MLKYCIYLLVFIRIIFDKYIGVMVFEIMNKYYYVICCVINIHSNIIKIFAYEKLKCLQLKSEIKLEIWMNYKMNQYHSNNSSINTKSKQPIFYCKSFWIIIYSIWCMSLWILWFYQTHIWWKSIKFTWTKLSYDMLWI